MIWIILPWLAVFILGSSFWIQAYKVYKVKDVKDLSLTSFAMFVVGYTILAVQAAHEGSSLFITKQVLTGVPAFVILCQIIYYSKTGYKDDKHNRMDR